MEENQKNKFLIGAIILLLIFCFITGYYAFTLREKYNNANNNNYTEAFSNLVDYVNSVEGYLAKSMVSNTPEHAAQTLTQIWRDSNLAMVYLARIPLENDGLSQTAKFLNQVSDYSYTLSRKNIEGESLNDEDFNNLKELYHYSLDLQNTLNQLSDDLYNGEINWDIITTGNNLEFAQAVDNVNVFTNIDDNLNEYQGLIYDGAFSEHITSSEKKGLTGEDIDEETAKQKAEEFIGKDKIKKTKSNGYVENGDIPVYRFEITTNEEQNIGISISKKGGHVVFLNYNRNVTEEKISPEEAVQKGKEYLNNKGFPNMQETYYLKENGFITVNYAYKQNNVVIYPDLIKVKIALDNGEIIGLESTGYLNNHYERNISKNLISIEDAKKQLTNNIEIKSEGLAIIPTEWNTEILCYEFKGKVEDIDFIAYINAETGEEEDILIITNTPNGTLTE